jgi:capsular polysaccharide biosynthesis protein
MLKQEFIELVENYLTQLDLFDTKGVKIAGTRARKFAQEIKQEMTSSRAKILSKQKS